MGILQLVEHASASGHDYETLPNPDERPSALFRDENTRPVLWGSSDLVSVALRLRNNGFHPVDVTLSDEYLSPLPDDEAEYAKGDVLEHLSRDDDPEEVVANLDCLVLAVTLRRKGLGQLRLVQNGRIQVSPSSNQEGLLTSLRQAIRATR